MSAEVLPAAEVMASLVQRRIVERLVRRGVLRISAFTPTDANHVLDRQHTYDSAAAHGAATLFARRRDRLGNPIGDTGHDIAERTIATLVRRSAEAVLAAAFLNDGFPADTVTSRAVQASLDGAFSVVTLPIGLSLPLVGLGASAPTYYPAVAALVGTSSVIPTEADVANAVGAVVGRVRISHECLVSAPQPGQYVVHTDAGPEMFTVLDAARARAVDVTAALLCHDMEAAGAHVFETVEHWHEATVEVSGSPMFVEGVLTLTGSGRPDLPG